MKKIILSFLIFLVIANGFGQTTSALRIDGVMLKNGEQFFPIGYYAEGYNTLEENNYAANVMAQAGFNIIFTEHDAMSTNDFSIFLDNCEAKGIYNILSFWDPSAAISKNMNTFIPMFKNKPSVLAWGIGDDASTNGTVQQILYKNSLSKLLDNNHLTMEAFNGVVRETVKEVDISGTEHYVVFNPTDRVDGYDSWAYLTEDVAQCEANGKLPIEIAQAFIYGESDKFPYPSPAQCDVYSYFSLVAGMKGLMFYTFRNDSAGTTVNLSHPKLWEMTSRVSTEIQSTLKDMLLNGNRTTVANVNTHVYYAKWRYHQEEYVIAVNTDNVAHSVTIPVLGTTKNSLFAYRNNTLSINGGNLTGTLGKLDVQIYKITDVPADVEAPGIPKGLSASAISTTSFTLSWIASTDNVKVVGYEVFNQGNSVGTTKTNSINITGLVCETAGTYTVKAFDFDNNISAVSNALEITTVSCNGDIQPPSVPNGLAALSINASSFKLKWNKATDDIAVTGYDVYKDGSYYKSTIDTSMLISPLLSLNSYTMAVKAKDSAGHISNLSSEIVVTTSEDIAPSKPFNLVIESITTDGCTLKWDASTDNVGVAGYEVYIGAASIGTTAANSMIITGLGCGIRLFLSVVAYDPTNNRSDMAGTSLITADCNLDKLYVKQEIWTGIAGKEVAKIPVTTTPNQVKILSTLETYCYAGENTGNRIRGYIIAPETGAYTFYICSDDNGEFWLSTTDQPINKVKVAYMPYWDGSRIWFNDPHQKSRLINLVKDQRYYFEALMKNGDGGDNLAVAWTRPGTLTIDIISTPYIDKYTDDFEAPAKIVGLMASDITQTSFVLSWNRSSDNVGIDKYEVYKGTEVFGSTADTLLLITGLYAGSTYSMSVKARDAVAYSSNISEALKVTLLLTSVATKEKNMIEVYPNPATSNFWINNVAKNSKVKVVRIDGKLVTKVTATGNNLNINSSGWSSGIYIIQVQSENEFVTEKIVIE